MFSRYAVYYAPRPGAFAGAAATWLGRNCETDLALPQPAVEGLADTLQSLTTKPRKYGFHGTLRAPFRPAGGQDGTSIAAAVAEMSAHLSPARCDGLAVGNPYGFGVALKPIGDETEVLTLAAAVVEQTDHLRAALTPEEIAQRETNENLNPRQREYLHRWGYPMVMEELSFQLTLSNEPPPVCRRPFGLSYAAMAGRSREWSRSKGPKTLPSGGPENGLGASGSSSLDPLATFFGLRNWDFWRISRERLSRDAG